MVHFCYLGAQRVWGPYFGVGNGPIVLDNVYCNSSEATLLDCQHVNLTDSELHRPRHVCKYGGGAGVRCPNPLKNISVEFINTSHYPVPYVRISWELHSTVIYQPTTFTVLCSNYKLQHRINVWVDNKTFTVQLGQLLPSPTYYNCCVGAEYISDVIDEICMLANKTVPGSVSPGSIPTDSQVPNKFVSGKSHLTGDDTTSIVGGVLGFITVVLLILLVICGGALLFLLRSRSLILKR